MASTKSDIPYPRVNPLLILGVAWGGVTLTTIFLIARGYARISAFKRLFWDDAFVVAAWMMLLVVAFIWQYRVQLMYDAELILNGLMLPNFVTLPGIVEAYLRATLVVLMTFYTSLYFVKFSFLLFFRKLGDKVRGQTIHWWIVTGITVAAWVTSLAILNFRCHTSSFAYAATNCISAQSVKQAYLHLDYATSIDVITDALVMSIPISILWKVKINLRQKLALVAIFSLTILTMVFAIIRVAVVRAYSDLLWLHMWSAIEQTVAILVACLVSFRVFFTKSSSPDEKTNDPKQSGQLLRNLWAGPRLWFGSNSHGSDGSTVGILSLPVPRPPLASRSSDDIEHNMVSLSRIHVNKTFTATSAPYDEDQKTFVQSRQMF